jgi:hypothetical protein
MENSHRSSAVVPLVALPAVFSGLNVSSTDDRATRWNMETQTGLSAGDRVDAGLAEPLSCRSKGTLCQATVDMESRSIPPLCCANALHLACNPRWRRELLDVGLINGVGGKQTLNFQKSLLPKNVLST